MTDKDGTAKNISVVLGELKEWLRQMREGAKRFKRASLLPTTWRPLSFPKDNTFHLIQNLISETFEALPRTFGYLASILIVVSIVRWLW